MEEILWYSCPNDSCLKWKWPVDVLRGEEPVCSECGWFMNALYDPPDPPGRP